ncbi:TdeIII family type II restriction endonuclease [Ferrimonas pelagia]|uniref:type II site-specific deoxyribonuclease n=1 Tax=Ferrimonas pelagia TaxID=1177826 RepID=A0ABP9EX87_9GAMM
MKAVTRQKIKEIVHSCVERAANRTARNLEGSGGKKPFHEALFSTEALKFSAFERSFSTSFGQGPIEEISLLIAKDNGFEAIRQHEEELCVFKGSVDEIEQICSSLRDGNSQPNWNREKKRICSFNKGDVVSRRLISDLYLTKLGVKYYVSIKTVKPNLDQTEKAKRDMLLCLASSPENKPVFALYYNPYGEEKIDYAHSVPNKLFDMSKDECVLIGKEYWDFLGGKGTYSVLLALFDEVGKEAKLIVDRM